MTLLHRVGRIQEPQQECVHWLLRTLSHFPLFPSLCRIPSGKLFDFISLVFPRMKLEIQVSLPPTLLRVLPELRPTVRLIRQDSVLHLKLLEVFLPHRSRIELHVPQSSRHFEVLADKVRDLCRQPPDYRSVSCRDNLLLASVVVQRSPHPPAEEFASLRPPLAVSRLPFLGWIPARTHRGRVCVLRDLRFHGSDIASGFWDDRMLNGKLTGGKSACREWMRVQLPGCKVSLGEKRMVLRRQRLIS
mmetsp:Transcript_6309/g.14493  ORF Transcript_6309/g.14493 Transcript_6309/m.14493 type:complete len:246 (-) Transcript_6309:112-849(-)